MKRVRLLEAVARRLRIPLAHLALKWVLRDGGVASALIGARTVRQLDDFRDSLAGPSLSPGDLAEIETILS